MSKTDELRRRAEEELQMAKEKDHIPASVSELMHELQVHQIELQIQNEELRKSQEEVSGLYSQYHELYDHAPVGYFTLDKDGIIRNVNIKGSELLQLNKKRIIGRGFSRFISKYNDKYYYALANAINTDKIQSVELQLKGNKECYVYMEIMIVHNSDEMYRITITDITKRKKSEDTVKESEEKYRQWFEDDLTGDFIATPEGELLECNSAFLEIYGFNDHGMAIQSNISEFNCASWIDLISTLKKERKIKNREVWLQRHDGKRFHIAANVIGVFNDSNELIQVKGYVFDDTERKNAEEKLKLAHENLEKQVLERTVELKHAVKELKESNDELQQFAYVSSHDLQEPLRTIASFTQLLEKRYKSKLDSDADEFIEYIVDATIRMKQQIQDLLEFSRVTTNKEKFKLIDTTEILNQTIENLHDSIKKSNAEITHDKLPIVRGNAGQLQRVFQNLISNAIKFRKCEESIKIHISAYKTEDGNEYVFSVKDNGIGIEEQYLERIFTIFQRLHTREEYHGTGIGLSIVKKIIERHGGRIWVESEFGIGSTFYFTIPIKE